MFQEAVGWRALDSIPIVHPMGVLPTGVGRSNRSVRTSHNSGQSQKLVERSGAKGGQVRPCVSLPPDLPVTQENLEEVDARMARVVEPRTFTDGRAKEAA